MEMAFVLVKHVFIQCQHVWAGWVGNTIGKDVYHVIVCCGYACNRYTPNSLRISPLLTCRRKILFANTFSIEMLLLAQKDDNY